MFMKKKTIRQLYAQWHRISVPILGSRGFRAWTKYLHTFQRYKQNMIEYVGREPYYDSWNERTIFTDTDDIPIDRAIYTR